MKKISYFILSIICAFLFTCTNGCKNNTTIDTVTIEVKNGSGSCSVKSGELVSIEAALNDGDQFIGWEENGEIISTENPYQFIAKTSRTFTAKIEASPVITKKEATVTVIGGSGSGVVEVGSMITIIADKETGKEFSHWESNGKKISVDEEYTFQVRTSLTIYAKYIEVEDLSKYTFTINKKKGEDFVICNFTDIQLHDGEKTDITFEVIDQVVKKTNPDLIVFLGDLLNDNRTFASIENSQKVFDYFDSLGIPWTFIFGNHDYEDYSAGYVSKKTVTSDDLIERASKCKNCIFTRGPLNVTGKSNFIINVVEEGQIRESLIMLDSKLNGLDSTHTEFYQKAMAYIKQLNNGILPESIVYSHIANTAYADASNDSKACEYQDVTGSINRDPCDLASGDKTFFTTLEKIGSTKFCICGHDHENAYYTTYHGIDLIYTMKSSEGDNYTNYLQMGGSIFKISDQTTFEFVKANIPLFINAPITLCPDTTPNWQKNDKVLSFDIEVSNETAGKIQFALFGTNTHRTDLSTKDQLGAWNRLTTYIDIDISNLSCSVGTITKTDKGYHFECKLNEFVNNTGTEKTDGTETLRLIYFNKVEVPFTLSNFEIK